MASSSIRAFQEKDFTPLAQIYNEIYTDRATFTAEKLKASEDRTPKHLFREFYIAEQNEQVVAACLLTQDQLFSKPGWYFMNIWVRPLFQRQGVGGYLFDHLLKKSSELKATKLQCATYDTFKPSIRFLEKLGFAESYRNFESRMELSQFNPNDYSSLDEKLEKNGITLHHLSDLKDPNHRQKIYALQANLEREVPGSELRAVLSFADFWSKADIDHPDGEFFCVAMKQGEYIGLHFGSPPPGSEWFMVRVTGVLPQFRHLGVATALKARGMIYAKQKGMPGAFTWNDSRNQPILTLNEKFGFKRQPACVQFAKEL